MTQDWEWWCVLESDDMILRVMIPDWEWYQAEPTRVICWGSVNRVEWKPQSRHRVSFEIKRWPKSAGTEIVRHIFILTFLLMMMRYFLILCLSQFSSWQFRVQFRSVGGWYKFCERLGARSGRGRSKLFFGWFVARCTFPAIWRFEVEVQIWGLGDSGINI